MAWPLYVFAQIDPNTLNQIGGLDVNPTRAIQQATQAGRWIVALPVQFMMDGSGQAPVGTAPYNPNNPTTPLQWPPFPT